MCCWDPRTLSLYQTKFSSTLQWVLSQKRIMIHMGCSIKDLLFSTKNIIFSCQSKVGRNPEQGLSCWLRKPIRTQNSLNFAPEPNNQPHYFNRKPMCPTETAKWQEFCKKVWVSNKPTYPSPKPTLTFTSPLGQNVGLADGKVGGMIHNNL